MDKIQKINVLLDCLRISQQYIVTHSTPDIALDCPVSIQVSTFQGEEREKIKMKLLTLLDIK